jgi:hypothetical protein
MGVPVVESRVSDKGVGAEMGSGVKMAGTA